MKTELDHTEYPLRQIARTVTAVLVAIGAALTSMSASLDWAWLPAASTAVASAVGIIAAAAGLRAGERHVWPDQKVQGFLAHAQSVEPGPEAVATLTVDDTDTDGALDLGDDPDDLPDLDLDDIDPGDDA